MNKKQQRHRCELCLYLILATFFFMLMAYVTPQVDREAIRSAMAVVTSFASIIGMVVCSYAGWFLAKDHDALSRRLLSVYVMTGAVFLCTLGMGLAGYFRPSVEVWDIVYNVRGFALVLDVIAAVRFVHAWVKITK